MNVAIVRMSRHPLLDALSKYLAARRPPVSLTTFSGFGASECRGPAKLLKAWGRKQDLNAIVYLPPQHGDVSLGIQDFVAEVINLADRCSARLIMISGPEASNLNYRVLPVGEARYGAVLAESENMIRAYRQGIVLRVPLLNSSPRIALFAAVVGSRLRDGEFDLLFNIADAKEVAEIIGDSLDSGWYGLHQIGSGEPIRMSSLVGCDGSPGTTYNYSLPGAGLAPSVKTPSKDVWRLMVSKG